MTLTRASRHGALVEFLPTWSRRRRERFPCGFAARASRTVSGGTGPIACGVRDSYLLLGAIPGRWILRFFTCLFLSRQALAGSPAVSARVEIHIAPLIDICQSTTKTGCPIFEVSLPPFSRFCRRTKARLQAFTQP
jgi:hypothetical protein